MAVFSGCNKDEVIVKFDKKTFIEQKKLWQLSNTKDYEYNLLAKGFIYYDGKIIVENGSFKNDVVLYGSSLSVDSFFLNYSTIDLVYKTIEEKFNSNNGATKSDFYCAEIFGEYDKINHIPIKINYKYYCYPNLVVHGTFDYTITNFSRLN